MLAKFSIVIVIGLVFSISCWSKESLAPVSSELPLLQARSLRGIGVNYFNAISRAINRPGDYSYRQGLQVLSDYDIPFVRVMFGAYWPSEMELYRNNPKRYFEILDDFVLAAEEQGIGIVANLAWNYPTIPDLVNEPVSAWGKKNSKTNVFFRKYVAEVVSRYRYSSSIWMWEFSNEMSLYVNLPNASEWRAPINPQKGTPAARSVRDDISHNDMLVAMSLFHDVVRTYDQKTPISSGNSLPRPYAFHNSLDGTWKKDSESQFCEILARDNPVGFDVISVHIYPSSKGYFGAAGHDSDAIVNAVSKCSKRVGKPIFVGEFGASEKDADSDPDGVSGSFRKIYGALMKNKIYFSALWVFDFQYQERTHNVTSGNSRSHFLDEIRELNRQIKLLEQ